MRGTADTFNPSEKQLPLWRDCDKLMGLCQAGGARYTPLNRPARRRSVASMVLIALCAFIAMALFTALLSIGHCMFSWGGAKCYHGYESPYSFDIDQAYNPDWMASIPDDVNITSLSIPGTHDTMTYDMVKNIRLQCQSHNLSTQLNAGVRYFDIRGRLVNHTIGIYHSFSYTGYTFTDVALEMFAFLDAHPDETIIMRLKEEGKPVGDAKEWNKTFEEVFNHFRLENPETSPGFSKHLFEVPVESPQSAYLPTLGDLRGKILLLENFPAEERHYGLLWESPLMELEDLWAIPTIYHLEDKWVAIESNLHLARNRPDDNSVLFLSHLSASFGVLPIEAAAGPLNDRQILGMNDRTGIWLEDPDTPGRAGVVIIDFPGKALVDSVIERNAGLTKRVDGGLQNGE